MTRDVVLQLDDFSHHALESFIRERPRSHSAAVRTASLYYLGDRDAARQAWPVPRFATGRRTNDGHGATVTVQLDEETWEGVTNEAERQQVPAGTLVEHAIVYFLADLDSGRIASRLDEVLGETEWR